MICVAFRIDCDSVAIPGFGDICSTVSLQERYKIDDDDYEIAHAAK